MTTFYWGLYCIRRYFPHKYWYVVMCMISIIIKFGSKKGRETLILVLFKEYVKYSIMRVIQNMLHSKHVSCHIYCVCFYVVCVLCIYVCMCLWLPFHVYGEGALHSRPSPLNLRFLSYGLLNSSVLLTFTFFSLPIPHLHHYIAKEMFLHVFPTPLLAWHPAMSLTFGVPSDLETKNNSFLISLGPGRNFKMVIMSYFIIFTTSLGWLWDVLPL